MSSAVTAKTLCKQGSKQASKQTKPGRHLRAVHPTSLLPLALPCNRCLHMLVGRWGLAPHVEENSWGGPAPHTQPMSGMRYHWPDVSGQSVFREETIRERSCHLFMEACGYIQELHPDFRAGWVGWKQLYKPFGPPLLLLLMWPWGCLTKPEISRARG